MCIRDITHTHTQQTFNWTLSPSLLHRWLWNINQELPQQILVIFVCEAVTKEESTSIQPRTPQILPLLHYNPKHPKILPLLHRNAKHPKFFHFFTTTPNTLNSSTPLLQTKPYWILPLFHYNPKLLHYNPKHPEFFHSFIFGHLLSCSFPAAQVTLLIINNNITNCVTWRPLFCFLTWQAKC